MNHHQQKDGGRPPPDGKSQFKRLNYDSRAAARSLKA